MAALWKAPDVVRLVLCVVAVTFAYLTIGTTDLTSYFPIHHQPRYLLVLMPLATILVVHAFQRLRDGGRVRRWVAAALAVALVFNTIQHANVNAGKSYAAATFTAGRKLFDSGPPGAPAWLPEARLCASGETMFRLWPLIERSRQRSMEQITQPPATRSEWLLHYEGAYVVVSKRDRLPDRDALGVLNPHSRAALAAFPVVASAAAGQTRLREIGAWLGLCEYKPDRECRIDVYHVVVSSPTDATSSQRSSPSSAR